MVSRPEHEPEVIGAAYAAGLKAGRDLTVLEDACPHPVVVGALSWAWLEGFAAGRKDMGQREH